MEKKKNLLRLFQFLDLATIALYSYFFAYSVKTNIVPLIFLLLPAGTMLNSVSRGSQRDTPEDNGLLLPGSCVLALQAPTPCTQVFQCTHGFLSAQQLQRSQLLQLQASAVHTGLKSSGQLLPSASWQAVL